MNIEEFRRRLRIDPGDPELKRFVARNPALAGEWDAAQRLEQQIRDVLEIPVPAGLAERLLDRCRPVAPARRSRGIWLALAASVAVVAVLAGLIFGSGVFHQGHGAGLDGAVAVDGDTLRDHLRWHWDLDGAVVMHAADQVAPDRQAWLALMARFDVRPDPELLEQVAFVKLCPTPGGEGLHMVLHTDSGPVTAFYFPHARMVDASLTVDVDERKRAWATALDRGGLVLMGEAGQPLEALGRQAAAHLTVGPEGAS